MFGFGLIEKIDGQERNGARALIITVMTKDRGASGSAESNAGCIDNAESGKIPRHSAIATTRDGLSTDAAALCTHVPD